LIPLTSRTGHAFRDAIRWRGEVYARERRVAITISGHDRASGRVRGSAGASYRVELRVIPHGRRVALGVACSCPYFNGDDDDSGGGDCCKHLWAALVELDEHRWNPPAFARSASGPIRVVELTEDDPELNAMEELDDDIDAPFESAADEPPTGFADARRRALAGFASRASDLAATAALDGKRGGVDRVASWRRRVGNLTSVAFAPRAPNGMPPILYLLDPAEIRATQRVRVAFARRPLRRDGTPGALSEARISVEDIPRAATCGEGSALAQLLTLAQTEFVLERGPYGYAYARDPSRIRCASVSIPTALHDPVLPRLAATGRLVIVPSGPIFGAAAQAEPQPLQLDDGAPWQLRLALGADPAGGYALRGSFRRDAATLAIEDATLMLAGGFLVEGATLARAEIGRSVNAVAELRRGPLRIPERDLDAAMEQIAAAPDLAAIDLAPEVPWTERTGNAVPRLRFEGVDGSSRNIEAQLDFGYGDAFVEADSAAMKVPDRRTRTLFARDDASEAAAMAALGALGFQLAVRAPGFDPARVALPARDFEAAARELLAKGWILAVDGARLRSAGRSSARVRSGIDFFELQGAVDFDGTAAPFPALLAAAREGSRFVRLGDGSRGLLPRAWLDRCAGLASCAESIDGALRFGRAQAGILDALLEVQDDARVDRRFAAIREKLARFAGIAAAEAPASFRGTLREYQREGLGWLHFLRDFELGGCLADDMGLGKTVQVLALLAGRAKSRRGGKRTPRTSLVVAPKSVVHGWIDEAARFAPALRVLRYVGSDRAALRDRFDQHDLVVASYGTLLRDIEQLAALRFDYAILDEAQAIKNAASRTARAVKTLHADHRLALTGTPVENHLGELASLLEFLNPGLLGRARGFAALMGGRQDEAAIALLARTLRPFLLRRTKAQVLAELPAKTEQTILCDLDGKQRRDYDELRRHYQAALAERVERDGLARSKIHVLEALLRLRQAACHPALIDPSRAAESSAKLDVLFEQLDEVLDEGHKVLIFSQFTRLLARVRQRLDERVVPYAYLDGRTRDRKERVARFQEDPDCRVFLISLKAGGTGLNLTAADYVFLLDPWWNPAVEAQAIDRTHRIGQTRPVFAYRLVARDTVEERILELQERKRSLAGSIFTSDESLVASLDAEDLRRLLD
jgi:superfamily II DNA or RNA helicase